MDAVGLWTLVRFAHVTGAVLWVGGQLALSLVVLPLARRMLAEEPRARFTAEAGRRFGILTGALFLPVQLGTGWALAWYKGVTWVSLAEPGYGRTLATKLGLFTAVMVAAAAHGWAHSQGRPELARALAVASLVGSLGVVLLATALPAT
jgi:putative copper export protein